MIVATIKKENELSVLIRITRIYDLFHSLEGPDSAFGMSIDSSL
jgi:hypothetical protein